MKVLPPELQARPRSRRLRKKLKVVEFQELGFMVNLSFDPHQLELEQVIDHWLLFVESQGWSFGGGGSLTGSTLSGYLVQFEQGSMTAADRQTVSDWLTGQPWNTAFHCGVLTDAWHGPWEEEE